VTTRQDGIDVTFAWDRRIEELYASWRKRADDAERAHSEIADRFGARHVTLGVLVVLTAALTAAAAFAALSDAGSTFLTDNDIALETVLLAAGIGALAVAVLAFALMLGRYATRAERHRNAALRYESLEREMTAALALPRDARPRPDATLTAARDRIDRYAKQSPAIGRRLRRKLQLTTLDESEDVLDLNAGVRPAARTDSFSFGSN
jgi:hypothetical protein